MDSEKTKAQKEVLTKLQDTLRNLENYKTYFTKFVMEDSNSGNAHFARVQSLVPRLRAHIQKLHDEIEIADTIWLGFQLDDLEEELNG